MEKNDEQCEEPKQLGEITGRGFLSGRSGNPNGRPRTWGLVNALKPKSQRPDLTAAVLRAASSGVLLQEPRGGRHRLAAVEVIFDRLEGCTRQPIEVADATKELP